MKAVSSSRFGFAYPEAHPEIRRAGAPSRNTSTAALAILAALAAPAHAIDYSAGATLDAQVSHNDNLRMADDGDDKVSVTKYMFAPLVSLKAVTERTTLEFNSIFYFNQYDESDYNSNDQNIGFNVSHQFETSTVALNANLVRDSTITSELLTSGRVGETAERAERYTLIPSWTYYVNDTNMLQLTGNYQKQEYDLADFTGYESTNGSLDWIHILNERWKLVLNANYDYQEYDDRTRVVPPFSLFGIPPGYFGTQTTSTRTRTAGGQLGFDYQWSEQSTLQARLGNSKSKTEYPLKSSQNFCEDPLYQAATSLVGPLGQCGESEDSSDRLLTVVLGWTWKNENHNFSLNGTKRTQPTSNAYTVDSLQLNSNWSYNITELDQFSVGVTMVRNRALDDAATERISAYADRDFGAASVSYRRQFGEDWFVTATYAYNRQKYAEFDTDAKANIASLSIRYRPQAWHWAR